MRFTFDIFMDLRRVYNFCFYHFDIHDLHYVQGWVAMWRSDLRADILTNFYYDINAFMVPSPSRKPGGGGTTFLLLSYLRYVFNCNFYFYRFNCTKRRSVVFPTQQPRLMVSVWRGVVLSLRRQLDGLTFAHKVDFLGCSEKVNLIINPRILNRM